MKQILCLSHTHWQARPNRTQQLMTRLTDAQILYFEPPAPRGAPKPEQGRRIRSHITVYTLPASLPVGPIRTFSQRHALRRNAAFIRAVTEQHRFRTPVLWCTSPEQAGLIGRVPCRGIVYDCHHEWSDEYVEQESDLTSHAEVVFAASPGLVQRLSPCNDNIALLPNGVSPIMFLRDDFVPPEHLSYLSGRPVLGRVGDITGQMNLKPILTAAAEQPNWAFLLIGRTTKTAHDLLSAHQNIILAGPVNAAELPDYLSLCTILFDLTRSDQRGCDILPARIYEYLATGKPIVMMAEPDFVEPYPDVIYTAFDSTGFLRRCRKALSENTEELSPLRKAYAEQAAWSARAAEIERILESTGLFH